MSQYIPKKPLFLFLPTWQHFQIPLVQLHSLSIFQHDPSVVLMQPACGAYKSCWIPNSAISQSSTTKSRSDLLSTHLQKACSVQNVECSDLLYHNFHPLIRIQGLKTTNPKTAGKHGWLHKLHTWSTISPRSPPPNTTTKRLKHKNVIHVARNPFLLTQIGACIWDQDLLTVISPEAANELHCILTRAWACWSWHVSSSSWWAPILSTKLLTTPTRNLTCICPPLPQRKKMRPPECMFSYLIGCMQILFLKWLSPFLASTNAPS